MKWRILIVDDHQLVREGVSALLKGNELVEVVGHAEDAASAIEQVRALKPDIVLMDIALPGTSGVQATRHITQEFPGVRVLALTMYSNREYITEMLKAGAAGYVLKRAAARDLIQAVETVGRGEYFLEPSVTRTLIEAYVRGPLPEEAGIDLTEREREVLNLVAEGLTTREMAEKLHLSTRTIQYHRARVMEKMGASNVTELIRYALKAGLIRLQDQASGLPDRTP